MSGNAFDPPQDEISPDAPKVEYVQFSVNIEKAELLHALENQAKWQHLWQRVIPETSFKSALDMKYFVVNGFKPIENQEQVDACTKKIKELETPLPQIHVMPANAKVPENVKKAIGIQGHNLHRPK